MQINKAKWTIFSSPVLLNFRNSLLVTFGATFKLSFGLTQDTHRKSIKNLVALNIQMQEPNLPFETQSANIE